MGYSPPPVGEYDNSDDTASERSLRTGGTLIFRSAPVLRMGLFVLRRNVGKMSVKSAVKFSPVSRQKMKISVGYL